MKLLLLIVLIFTGVMISPLGSGREESSVMPECSVTVSTISMIDQVPSHLFDNPPVEISTPSQAIEEPRKIKVILEPEVTQTYAGTYELTAYIATGNPCADGVYPSVGYTVASNDPTLWHRRIRINGYGEYYVHDTGGMSSNVIDIFVGSYSEAVQFGRRSAEVYIVE